MRIKVLGTQSPYAVGNHNCPGFLIETNCQRVMLDCGSGTHSRLNFPADLENLHIVLTHFHHDHYNDIFNILYASFVFHNQGRLEKPVEVFLPYTPANIRYNIMFEDNAYAKYGTISQDADFTIGELKLSFLKVNHPVETYAVKITDGVKTVVYTSDISFSSRDDIVQFAKRANLFICESSLLEEYGFPKINSHLTASQAALIAKEAEVDKLLLTHFWPEEDTAKYLREAKQVFENVEIANEGDIFEIC